MKKNLLTTAFLLLMGFSVSGQSLSDSLKVHFQFKGNSQDISGNGNHGTVMNALWEIGLEGKDSTAYYFDGSGDYITFPSDDIFTQEYTYSLWFRYDYGLVDGTKQVILGIGGNDCDQSINLTRNYVGYNGLNAGGYYQIGGTFNSNSPSIPTESKWTHVASVKSNDSITIYVGGVKIMSNATPSQTPCYSGTNPRGVLGSGVALNQPFEGAIDEVRIYNRPLSAQEIQNIYTQTLTSIAKVSTAPAFSVYPNPVQNKELYIRTEAQIEKIQVFDTKGSEIMVTYNAENGMVKLNANVAAGTYYLNALTDQGIIRQIIIVQ